MESRDTSYINTHVRKHHRSLLRFKAYRASQVRTVVGLRQTMDVRQGISSHGLRIRSRGDTYVDAERDIDHDCAISLLSSLGAGSGCEIVQLTRLKNLFMIHNLYLTVISGALLVLFIEQLAPTIWKHGVFHSICGSGGWTKQLVVLYYVRWPQAYAVRL